MNLPIVEVLPELLRTFEAHRNVVLQAPPGAGKSTVVPLALLDAQWNRSGKIIMLEPRRLAARAVATRMAQQRGEAPGDVIGYRTRFDTKVGRQTRIEVVTEGILTRMLQTDAALEGVSLVIFDEFHERSLQADLGLALCLDVQATLRDDLRLLVMSATISTDAIATLLNAPVVTSSGRVFPVEIAYTGPAARDPRDIPANTARVVRQAIDQHPGDVLVFLPGQGEIRRTQSLLEGALPQQTFVRPLYGELDFKQQDLALRPSTAGERKIVLATNIAETSLTIEGVRIVVDSGLERRARFDPASSMNSLELMRVSRASADQRAGRAGRLAPGVCYRMWSQSEQASLRAHASPEIAEVDLAPLALELAVWGIRDVTQLRWLDAPPTATYNQARDLLYLLQAVDRDGKPTAHGRAISQLGLHPRLAHMVMRAADVGQLKTASRIAALLEERDVLKQTSDVDLRSRLDVLSERGSVPNAIVDEGARQRVLQSATQIESRVRGSKAEPQDLDVGALVAWAYPDRIAQARGESGRFLTAGGRGAFIAEAQSLSGAEYLAVATLDLKDREARIRLAAPLSGSTLASMFADSIETRECIEWSSRDRAVVARRERWLGAILLSERRLERPDATLVLQAMLAGVRESGLNVLPWNDESQRLRMRLQFVAAHANENSWPNVSDAALLTSLESWLAPWLDGISRLDHLARLDVSQMLRAMFSYEQQRELDQLAPTHFVVPSGSRIPIDYSTNPPTLAVRLQEVFGLQATPRVLNGRVALTLHLLSPAHRPVQVTQDLASFWKNGYADVKKEMKGRYPRHSWPDDPLTAAPTARAKPRGQ